MLYMPDEFLNQPPRPAGNPGRMDEMMTETEAIQFASEPLSDKTRDQFIEAAHAFSEMAKERIHSVSVDFNLRDEDGLCLDGTMAAIEKAEHFLLMAKHQLRMASMREEME